MEKIREDRLEGAAPHAEGRPARASADAPGAPALSLAEAVHRFEAAIISDTLARTKGNVKQAARLLGSTQRIIGYKVRKYGIDPEKPDPSTV